MNNHFKYIVAFVAIRCFARCNSRLIPVDDHNGGYPGESVKGITDLEVTLLRGATYAPSVSQKFLYFVYYKPGGYTRAEQDFESVMFHTDIKEWGNGVKSRMVGTQAVVLMPGSNLGYGWIRILNPGNPHMIEKRIVYVLAENLEGVDGTGN